MNKPNYYGILPAQVRYNKLITPNAKVLYSELTALCNKEGYCWASNKYFAKLYKTSEISVSNWVTNLTSQEVIKTEIIKTPKGTKRKIYLTPLKEIFKTPLKEIFKYNNTTTNTKKVSKDTKESKDSLRFKSPFTKKCIIEWNNIPFTQNILITRRTKTITKLERYITQLLKGTFMSGRDNKTFDMEWFNQNKIPVHTVPFTKKEILVTIKNTSLYSKEGYFTENKSYMPKDLATLMYNPRTGRSWFLLAFHKKPKPFNPTLVDPDPKTSKYLCKVLGISYDSPLNAYPIKCKLFAGINSIRKFVMNIPKKSTAKFKIRNEVGTPYRIAKQYIEWIEHQDWIDNGVKLSILNANNRLWKKFIKDKEREYDGYKLS